MPRATKTIDLPAVAYDADQEHVSVITVRLPHATHLELLEQAKREDVSLNTLALGKLVAAVSGCQLWPFVKRPSRAERLRAEIRAEVAEELARREE